MVGCLSHHARSLVGLTHPCYMFSICNIGAWTYGDSGEEAEGGRVSAAAEILGGGGGGFMLRWGELREEEEKDEEEMGEM